MRSTSIFSCIMTMITNFTIFFIIQIFIFKLFVTNITGFRIFFYMIPAALLLKENARNLERTVNFLLMR